MRISIPALVMCLVALPVHAQYSGGSGTAEDPFQIATAEHLNAIGAEPNDWDKHFVLTADVDLSDYDGKGGRPIFRIIGAGRYESLRRPDSYRLEGAPFTGVFDGNGHAISQPTIVGRDFLGLFGLVESPAEIRDLAIVDVNVVGSYNHVGGLVGSNGFHGFSAGGLITDCSISGVVVGEGGSVGGLVGYNNGSITDCYSTGSVSGDYLVGGLVGANGGSITNCYSTASVKGQDTTGGLAGSNGWEYSGGTISNSYSSGTVTGQVWCRGASGQRRQRSCDPLLQHRVRQRNRWGLAAWSEAVNAM